MRFTIRVYLDRDFTQYEDYELTSTSEHNAKVIARESAVRQFGVDFHSTHAILQTATEDNGFPPCGNYNNEPSPDARTARKNPMSWGDNYYA